MDWSRGYSSDWRVFRVDPTTWADGEQVGGVDSASVDRVRGGLLESGSVTLTAAPGAGFEAGYYRIALYVLQDGAAVREDVATLYCSSGEGEVERGRDELDVVGRSVLYPASVRILQPGAYAPKGCDGAQRAAELLRACLAAPVTVEGGFTLDTHLVFDLGTSHLDAAWELLDAGGYCMQVGGDGTVSIMPMPTEPALGLADAGTRLLMPKVSHALDYSSVPNRYVAREGSTEAVATNDDPSSPTSTAARGYRHDEVDDSPKRVDGETLAEYARRRLAELSVVEDRRTYEREWWPGVRPYSLVRCAIAGTMEGDLRVVRQSLKLGHGILVTEEAAREVRTWQA